MSANDRKDALNIINRCRAELPVFIWATSRQRRAIRLLHGAAIYLATGKRATKEMRLHL